MFFYLVATGWIFYIYVCENSINSINPKPFDCSGGLAAFRIFHKTALYFILVIPVFMATKSCTKILNFSTRFPCQHFAVKDFVNALYGEKVLSMGKCYVWARFRNLFRLFYVGEIQNFGNDNVFFLDTGEICKRRQSCKLLLYRTTNSEAQTPTYVEVIPSFTHCRWTNTNTARQEYATLIKFCTLLCSELHTGSALMFCRLLAAKIPQILNSLHWG